MKTPSLLSQDEIIALDHSIDRWISELPEFTHSREEVIRVLARAFEEKSLLAAFRLNDQQLHAEISSFMDGLDYAVEWVLDYCTSTETEPPSLKVTNGHKLLQAALAFTEILKIMRKLRRAEQEVTLIDGVYCVDDRLAPADLQRHLCDNFVKNRNSPNTTRPDEKRVGLKPEPVLKACQPYLREDRIYYVVPKHLVNKIIENAKSWLVEVWKFDDNEDLGGYTAGDFRILWTCLYALSYIHHTCCVRLYGDTLKTTLCEPRIDNLTLCKKKNEWIRELSDWSKLKREVISAILDDIVCVPNVLAAKPKKERYEILGTPFFNIGGNQLLLCHSLILKVNIGRAISNLLNGKKRKTIYSRIQGAMAQAQKQRLLHIFKDTSIEAYANDLKISIEGEKSDLDLLLWNRQEKLIVGCQLKAFKDPHRPKEHDTVLDALQDGVRQGKITKRWMTVNVKRLVELTKVDQASLQTYQQHALVVSETVLGLDTFFDTEVPTINEALIEAVIKKRTNTPLGNLLKVARNQSYLPQETKHFKSYPDEINVSIGPFKFKRLTFAYDILRKWNPSEDVRA